MAIDVGSVAINRDEYTSGDRTIIVTENPANATGKINHIEVFIFATASTIEVASFEKVNGNTFTTRGTSGALNVVTGLNTFDAPGDFAAFDINAGDYIGCYVDIEGKVDKDPSGSGYWILTGDYVPCTNQVFVFYDARTISLYATGTEAEVGLKKMVQIM